MIERRGFLAALLLAPLAALVKSGERLPGGFRATLAWLRARTAPAEDGQARRRETVQVGGLYLPSVRSAKDLRYLDRRRGGGPPVNPKN